MKGLRSAELVIFVGGIVAAIAAGIYGYRTVGPYGDGPFAGDFYREVDPETGRSTIFRDRDTSRGHVKYIADESFRIREMRIDSNRDGTFDSVIGFNTTRTTAAIDANKDGTTDRWEHFDATGAVIKTGESSRGDGVEDTWTYLDKDGLLSRIENDQNRDGVIDKRQVFAPNADGSRHVLRVVEMDLDKNGLPRLRLTYGPDGSFEKSEVLRPK